MNLETTEEKAGLLVATLIIIGSILPWASARGMTFTGIFLEGFWTLIVGIISLILIVVRPWDLKNKISLLILGGFAILMIDVFYSVDGADPNTKVEIGAPFTLIAVVLLMVVGVVGIFGFFLSKTSEHGGQGSGPQQSSDQGQGSSPFQEEPNDQQVGEEPKERPPQPPPKEGTESGSGAERGGEEEYEW